MDVNTVNEELVLNVLNVAWMERSGIRGGIQENKSEEQNLEKPLCENITLLL